MRNRLVVYPDLTLAVPPRYCGTIDYYAAIASFGQSMVVSDARFDKRQKDVHRTVIADVNGALRLTVPVAKPESASQARWSDIKVSDHGNWADVHRTALESAYGRTPYFEYYAPRFLPLLVADNQPVVELDSSIDAEIRRILMLPPPVSESIGGRVADYLAEEARFSYAPVPYYQVRAGRLGFIPHLSVLDLIFNMGPESVLVLQQMIKQSHG
ncbi:MAG: WbqC family protein [Bacteroides sp.]|nr:WbqC family protein [Bacteroidales bacterium]MBD5252917.1 WbqC family protein [Barnesiella sp.]MBD5368397.1 WbqC family protein [Bacteroides sp.]